LTKMPSIDAMLITLAGRGTRHGLRREQTARRRSRLARRWPKVLGNAVDPAWARTKMGGPGAPVDLDTGQRPQSWLAVSDDPAAMVSGHYRQEQPAHEATDPEFQDELANTLGELTGVALPQA
jgi:hypothetical protein